MLQQEGLRRRQYRWCVPILRLGGQLHTNILPVSMPVPSAMDTEVPPIDPSAAALSRTAPTSLPSPPSKPKGCGRADCCQLPGSTTTPAKPAPFFPRFELKPYQPSTELIYPPALTRHVLSPLKFGSTARQWLRPTTVAQLLLIKAQHPSAKLVGGSSEIGIEVHIVGRAYPVSVYVSDIPELYAFDRPTADNPVLSFGANLPLAELDALCKGLIKELPEGMTDALKAIRGQLRYFAGFQIRNVASVAGNIATASPISVRPSFPLLNPLRIRMLMLS